VYVSRFDTITVESVTVKWAVVIDVVCQVDKPFRLQGFHFITTHAFNVFVPNHRSLSLGIKVKWLIVRLRASFTRGRKS
jgi:hypothetical protein